MTSADELLAQRYGRGPGASASKNRLWLTLFAVLATGVFLVWAWVSVTAQSDAISVVSSDTKTLTDTSFEVSAKIARPATGVVRCAVQVQSLNFAIVGYREVALPAGQESFTTIVYSSSHGVSASVARCWLQ